MQAQSASRLARLDYVAATAYTAARHSRVVGVNNHPVAPWEARAQEASLGYVAFLESHSSAGASPRVL